MKYDELCKKCPLVRLNQNSIKHKLGHISYFINTSFINAKLPWKPTCHMYY